MWKALSSFSPVPSCLLFREIVHGPAKRGADAVEIDRDEAIKTLNDIVELELAGVVRFTPILAHGIWARPHPDHGLDARAGAAVACPCHSGG